jgi:hypothetical protein
MHWVPKGRPLAHWVHDAISWARLIYLEYDERESERGRYAPPGSQPLAQRLPRSWPRIERKYPPKVLSDIAMRRPGADGVSNAAWDDAVSWALDNPALFKRVLETS